jgi:predicted ATP-grasp superfamily ATP-dependent carboligase
LKILVLDGNENQAVACVRSLAQAGHEVFAGAGASWSKAGWSKFCKGSFVYPAPQDNAEAFVEGIAEEVRKSGASLVLPMTERTTLPLSANRESIFSAGASLVLPPHETVLRAFDKRETTRVAESLGIAVPQTQVIANLEQAESMVENLVFPVVLKPRSSEEVSRDGNLIATGRPIYARNSEEFFKAYGEISKRCSAVLIQEFIEGTGAGYFALMRQGELRAEFAHRRIRDVHPTGSGSAVRVSAVAESSVREAALSILKKLSWHGVAMVEFRIRPDGQPVFLEVNGRFWNSLPLAVYAGADFPKFLAEMAEFGDVKSFVGYRAGVRCRWLLGDFRHLLEVWKGAPEGYPGQFPGRFESLKNCSIPVPGTLHDNFTLQDPLPELADWLDFAFRKFPIFINKRRTEHSKLHVEKRYSHS